MKKRSMVFYVHFTPVYRKGSASFLPGLFLTRLLPGLLLTRLLPGLLLAGSLFGAMLTAGTARAEETVRQQYLDAVQKMEEDQREEFTLLEESVDKYNASEQQDGTEDMGFETESQGRETLDMEHAYRVSRLEEACLSAYEREGSLKDCITAEMIWHVPYTTDRGYQGLALFSLSDQEDAATDELKDTREGSENDQEAAKDIREGSASSEGIFCRRDYARPDFVDALPLPDSPEKIADKLQKLIPVEETIQEVQYTASYYYNMVLIYIQTDQEEYVIPYAAEAASENTVSYLEQFDPSSPEGYWDMAERFGTDGAAAFYHPEETEYDPALALQRRARFNRKLPNGTGYRVSEFMKKMNQIFDEKTYVKNGTLYGLADLPYREAPLEVFGRFEPYAVPVICASAVIFLVMVVSAVFFANKRKKIKKSPEIQEDDYEMWKKPEAPEMRDKQEEA